MRHSISIILFFSLITALLQAETSDPTIYLKQKFFSGTVYVKNGVEYKLKDLKNELSEDPEAYQLYKNWKKYNTISIVLYSAGLCAAFGGLYMFDFNLMDRGNNLYYFFGGILLVDAFLIPSTIFAFKSSNALEKCLWIHNNNLMHPKTVRISLHVDPAGMKAGPSLQIKF